MQRPISCLVVDVGGTNTRLYYSEDIRIPDIEYEEIQMFPVRSISALKNAVVKTMAGLGRKPDSTLFAMAGIVKDHKTGMSTNWDERSTLSVEMFRSWGLPENTILVNDLEAAAYAIDAVAFATSRPGIIHLNSKEPVQFSNSVVIAPGTGLGMAVLVYADSKVPVVLTSEAQHCCAGSFFKRHRDIIRSYEDNTGTAPSWEDLVSGRGLEYLYYYGTGIKCSASRVAELGAEGNAEALRAIHDYYHFAAEAAQTLALLVRPTGGVYLCGDTTVKNKEIILHSDFADRFCANPVHGPTLADFPLSILNAPHLVISGGVRMGQIYFLSP